MSVPFWQTDQLQAERDRALINAQIDTHTNLSAQLGGGGDQADAFTRLTDILDKIAARLEAPRKPEPGILSVGLLAGGSVQRMVNLPRHAGWQLDTIILAQRPGATGTFVVTFGGLLTMDFTLASDPSGLQSKAVGIPVIPGQNVTLTEGGAGSAGLIGVHLIFTAL